MEIWRRAAGVRTCRTHRGMEFRRCVAGVASKEVCGIEIWRRAAGAGTCRTHRGMEVWRCAACVASKKVWSSGGTLQTLPQKRYGALAYCLLLLEFLAFDPQGWAKRMRFGATVIAVPPLTFALGPPEGAGSNCGHPTNFSELAPDMVRQG